MYAQCGFHHQVTLRKAKQCWKRTCEKLCNYRKKEEYPLEYKCRSKFITYKYVVTATGYPQKFYLGTAEGNFDQRYYNCKKLFRNQNMQTRHPY